MKRTDTHAPSKINPAEYEFICCIYYGEPGLNIEGTKLFRAHMDHTGGKCARITRDNGDNGSTGCDICGARCVNTARFYHALSNTYITTGLDCAEKMDMGDPIEFRSFRKRIAAGLKTMRGKRKAQELLQEHDLQAAWAIFLESESSAYTNGWDLLPKQEQTILDIIRNVVKYGKISTGQVNYLRTLVTSIANRPALEAKRAAEAKAAAPVPQTDERIKVVGKVLSTRLDETPYGSVRKMLVQHESGYKVWGSVPSGLDVSTGATIEFIAAVKRSNDDAKFGFFSRPTKASIVAAAEYALTDKAVSV